jgi:putative membrane protein
MITMREFVKLHGQKLAIGFISIMYTVGIVQVVVLGNTEILDLSPLQLLLSTFLVLLYQDVHLRNIILWVLIYLLGFGVEVLGVNTGFPFGSYSYGPVLGLKIWDTPLMIGVNWVLIILTTTQVADSLFKNANVIMRSFLSATLAVGLDFLIEPVAVSTNMWTWELEQIPVSNYLSWWLIAFVLSYLYQSRVRQNLQPVILVIFVWIIVFFAVLNLAL